MRTDHDGGRPPGFWSSRFALGWLVLGGVAAFFLLAEHWAHVMGALPYLLLLACPLMHLFMHGGHGHGHHGGQRHPGGSDGRAGRPPEPDESTPDDVRRRSGQNGAGPGAAP